jgi:hypothetical protein
MEYSLKRGNQIYEIRKRKGRRKMNNLLGNPVLIQRKDCIPVYGKLERSSDGYIVFSPGKSHSYRFKEEDVESMDRNIISLKETTPVNVFVKRLQ